MRGRREIRISCSRAGCCAWQAGLWAGWQKKAGYYQDYVSFPRANGKKSRSDVESRERARERETERRREREAGSGCARAPRGEAPGVIYVTYPYILRTLVGWAHRPQQMIHKSVCASRQQTSSRDLDRGPRMLELRSLFFAHSRGMCTPTPADDSQEGVRLEAAG